MFQKRDMKSPSRESKKLSKPPMITPFEEKKKDAKKWVKP
jgi:hypothetical protein